MDRIRRYVVAPDWAMRLSPRREWAARMALAAGVAAQLLYVATHDRGSHAIWYAPTAILLGTMVLVFGPRNALATWPMRAFLGLAFLGSVGDRFGLLGRAGSPGVSWGSFGAFESYTREVTSFLPGSWAGPLAVLATVAELSVGIGIVAGRFPWGAFAARVATCLLVVFGVAMTISLGWRAPFEYCVWLLAGSAWVLALPVRATWRRRSVRTVPPAGIGG